MRNRKKIVFLFPGQGAQYPGMAQDFVQSYSIAKQTFEEADDLLGRSISTFVFEGPEEVLTETKNSQIGIYVATLAMLRVVNQLFPDIVPSFCAGLSLGEYSALTASNRLEFFDGVSLVQHRGQYMNDACEAVKGTMAVVLGLDADSVEDIVREVNLPNDLWTANFNCPGQVVLSGTLKGIEIGASAVKAKGAKRVLPLQVHGAFHSGLMQLAEDRLSPHIDHVLFKESSTGLVMNVTGNSVQEVPEIRRNLIKQVTSPVRWEQGIRFLMNQSVDLFVEIGCGKTLTGFNKRIGVIAPSISIENISDLSALEEHFK